MVNRGTPNPHSRVRFLPGLPNNLIHMCIFCDIVEGRVEATKLYEDEEILVFLDIKPINSGHILIIPKKHSELINGVAEPIISKIFLLAGKFNQLLRKLLKAEGVNYFLADGEAAGQEVTHVHLHVFPRYKSDGFGFTFPDNYGQLPSRQKLDILSTKIKESLNAKK